MDRGMFPTYFLHMEREDGKKASPNSFDVGGPWNFDILA